MYPWYFLILMILAGVSAGLGLLFLFLGQRRSINITLHIAFAIFALSYAGTIASGALVSQTDSVAAYLAMSQLDAIFVIASFISLLYFVANYTGVKPRFFLWVLTAVYLIILTAALQSPNFIFEEIGDVFTVTLPWGESVTQIEAVGNIWEIVFFATELVMIGYLIFSAVKQYRRGERREASALLAGMSLFIFALLFDSFLIDTGVLNFVYLGDFGFLPLAILMSIQLADRVIETEEELATYQVKLENLVDERTRELRQSERYVRALLDAPPDTAMLINPNGIILDANEIALERLGLSMPGVEGKDIFELFPPEVARTRSEQIARLIKTQQHVHWEDERSGRNFDNRMYPIFDDQGQIVSIAVYAADITEQKQSEEALRQRIRELDALHQVSQIATQITELPLALEQISEIITQAFVARYTHLILPVSDSDTTLVLRGFDRQSGAISETQIDLPLKGLPLVDEVFRDRKTITISDIQSRSFPAPILEFISGSGIQHVLLTPIILGRAVIGMMAVSRDQPREHFNQDDTILAGTITNEIAGVLESARLQEQEKAQAAERERRRLARDLHDAVTQTIYSASLIAESLPTVWERSPDEGKRNLLKLRQLVRGALAEMRMLLFELRPAALEAAEITSLIGQLGDAMTGRTRIPVKLDIVGEAPPPSEVKLALYRITQEALNNIAKHSEATQVEISLELNPEQIILRVQDDGLGFETGKATAESMGMHIMKERAESIGAQLQIQSKLGFGTTISLAWSGASLQNPDSDVTVTSA